MSHHPLYSIDVEIAEVEDWIAHEDALEFDRSVRFAIVFEYSEAQIRYVFACIGFACDEESVVEVLGEFGGEEVAKSIEIVACCVGIVIGVVGIVVDAEAYSCGGIDEEEVADVGPRIGIEGEIGVVIIRLGFVEAVR